MRFKHFQKCPLLFFGGGQDDACSSGLKFGRLTTNSICWHRLCRPFLFHFINQIHPAMKFRFFSPALFALTFISLNLNAQPGIILDSVPPASTGQMVCVPLKAKGFLDVIAMTGSISWDIQILEYQNTQNHFLPALTTGSFNYNPQVGYLLFSWSDPSASCLSMDDDDTLWEICFNVIGSAGSGTDIQIDTADIWSCYLPNENLWTYVESPPIYFHVSFATNTSDFAVSKQTTFTLCPNPASTNAQVVFNSQKDGAAAFFVINALGQSVFEQKLSLNIGENQIQIPAETLINKGAYQVTLQTEQGAASQILIVR